MAISWTLKLLVIAGGFAWLAMRGGGPWLVLLWPAVSFAIVALSYLGAKPQVFGKSATGRLGPLSSFALLPFLLFTHLVWHLWRVTSREEVYAELSDGMFIGRRSRANELPDGVRSVVDLTCEFTADRAIVSRFQYECVPLLDATALPPDELHEVAKRIDGLEKPVYLHCAQGHGRTGMCAAAWLLFTGRAKSADAALQMVRDRRPGARPNHAQVESLHQLDRSATAADVNRSHER